MLTKIPFPKTQTQWRLLFGTYLLLIAFVSLTPADSQELPVRHIDKIGHFLAYLLMAVLALISSGQWRGRLLALFLSFVIAFILEWGQTYVPGRVASLTDGITNYLGLLAGIFLFRVYQPKSGNPNRRKEIKENQEEKSVSP